MPATINVSLLCNIWLCNIQSMIFFSVICVSLVSVVISYINSLFCSISRGPFVSAIGKTWHPEHFCCSACNVSLQNQAFVEENNQLFCEKCYNQYYAPKCAHCNNAIIGVSVCVISTSFERGQNIRREALLPTTEYAPVNIACFLKKRNIVQYAFINRGMVTNIGRAIFFRKYKKLKRVLYNLMRRNFQFRLSRMSYPRERIVPPIFLTARKQTTERAVYTSSNILF